MGFPLILSHRGANTKAPENTMEAFRLGLAEGADGIELDVQLSRDGQLMVIHDEKLDRTTDMSGLVCGYTAAELRKADAGVRFTPESKGARIPFLEEVLALLKGSNKLLNIELKTGVILYPGIEEKVISLVERYHYMEHTIISSFNHYSLRICKEINPDVKTGILYMSGLYEPWAYAATIKADALHPLFYNILNADKNQLHGFQSSGLMINPFTVNGREEIMAMAAKGVSAIITDVPDRAAEVKEEMARAGQ